MATFTEICLWFCARCGTVSANQRKLPDGATTVEEMCAVCREPTTHSPVAIGVGGQRFVTRVL